MLFQSTMSRIFMLISFLSGLHEVSIHAFSFPSFPLSSSSFLSSHFVVRTSSNRLSSLYAGPATADEQVDRFRSEADRIRKEAESLERTLNEKKIAAIQQKLSNANWLKKNPSQKEALERQLESLQKKCPNGFESAPNVSPKTTPSPSLPAPSVEELEQAFGATKDLQTVASTATPEVSSGVREENENVSSNDDDDKSTNNLPFIRGIEAASLEAYVPVAKRLESTMPDATIDDQLDMFWKAPEILASMEKKMKELFGEPMEKMQEVEKLRQKYLESSSKVEKTNIKRELDRLESKVEVLNSFYSPETFSWTVEPMSDDEVDQQVQALESLPALVQSLYKRARQLDYDADMRLAVLSFHYEKQLDYLESVGIEEEDDKNAVKEAIATYPAIVRDRLGRKYDLPDGSDVDSLIEAMMSEKDESASSYYIEDVMKLGRPSPKVSQSVAVEKEYRDIEFIDRSRFTSELFPALARLEVIHPSQDDIDTFTAEIVDKKSFMVTNRPERVIGGWFVRGSNMISDDELSGEKLVERLSERLEASSLNDKMEFFYILDPRPLSEEDIEMENEPEQILYVTAKNREEMFNGANLATKLGVSTLALISIAVFSVLTVALDLQPENIQATGELIQTGALPVFLSILAVQGAHEFGHWIAAIPYKMKLGALTIVPSVAFGLSGAITPLKTPPPNMKALFDVSISGPLVGFLASAFLLSYGLVETAALDLSATQNLPHVPISLLQASSLGGGLIEAILGQGALMRGSNLPPDALLSLHPAAIGGYVGLLTSALALLPLGNTDGGRISLAMFGRKASLLISSFSAALFCLAGVFGADKTDLLLTYTLFAVLWQRELEVPARNEVEQLDFGRGLVAIASAVVVVLTLLPMN